MGTNTYIKLLIINIVQLIDCNQKDAINMNQYGYDEVKRGTTLASQLKLLQQETNRALSFVDGDRVSDPVALVTNANVEPIKSGRQHKVIRRRRLMVYSQADQFLAENDYWHREKRSLTKFHSNSTMWEYTTIRDTHNQ